MRLASFGLIAALLVFATPGRAFTDAELINGFNRTVFGSEYQRFGWQSRVVKKFTKPVRLFVDDRSTARRRGEVETFVSLGTSLPPAYRARHDPAPSSAVLLRSRPMCKPA